MLCAMSVIARPRVLFLLGVLAAVPACGADDGPSGGADGRPSDAAVDALPTDATPTGMVSLGVREMCPREVAVHGDRMYWLERDVLVRSPVDIFSPEVVYSGVSGDGLRVGENAVYWVGSWPVRLDLTSREARPLTATPVSSLEVVDGRPIVIDEGGMRVAEIDGKGNLDDLYAVARDPMSGLARSGRWLFWGRIVGEQIKIEWLDAVDGTHGSATAAGYIRGAAVTDRVAVIHGRKTGGSFAHVVDNGFDRGSTDLGFYASKLAVDGQGAVFAVNESNYRLFRAPSLDGPLEWTQIDASTSVQHLAGLATGAIVVSCSSGAGVFQRWYP
jgi:hypothetical protein